MRAHPLQRPLEGHQGRPQQAEAASGPDSSTAHGHHHTDAELSRLMPTDAPQRTPLDQGAAELVQAMASRAALRPAPPAAPAAPEAQPWSSHTAAKPAGVPSADALLLDEGADAQDEMWVRNRRTTQHGGAWSEQLPPKSAQCNLHRCSK